MPVNSANNLIIEKSDLRLSQGKHDSFGKSSIRVYRDSPDTMAFQLRIKGNTVHRYIHAHLTKSDAQEIVTFLSEFIDDKR